MNSTLPPVWYGPQVSEGEFYRRVGDLSGVGAGSYSTTHRVSSVLSDCRRRYPEGTTLVFSVRRYFMSL